MTGDYDNTLTSIIVAKLLYPDTFSDLLSITEEVDNLEFQKYLESVLNILNRDRVYREMSYYDVEDVVDELLRFYKHEEKSSGEPDFIKSNERKDGKPSTPMGRRN